MSAKQTWRARYDRRATGWTSSEGRYDYIVVELPDLREIEIPVTEEMLNDLRHTPQPPRHHPRLEKS